MIHARSTPMSRKTLRRGPADMTLHIRPEPTPSKPVLRDLIIASIDSFLGQSSVLDAELSCSGCPILALDAERRLMLISFDPEDGIQALLSGLAAWHETRAGSPWLRRLYPELRQADTFLPPRLVVLMPTLPPGITLLATGEDSLQIFRFRVLAVDGQTALFVEPATELPVATTVGDAPQLSRPDVGTDSNLTDEETAFLESSRP